MLNPKNRELSRMEASRKEQASLMSRNANLKVIKTKQALKHTPTFDDDEAVAERIKFSVETMEARLGVGNDLSYPEIAEVCEVSQKVVYGWAKNGKISKAKIPTLCAVLGVSVEYLLTGNEPEKGTFAQSGSNLTREVGGVGGLQEETIVPVPIREPVELIARLKDDNAGTLTETTEQWLTDSTEARSLAMSCLAPDHIRTPTWTLQIITRKFEPYLPMGSFAMMTHKILPMEDDFAVYLYRKNGAYQIAMGFVTYINHDFSQATFQVDTDGFLEYAFKQPIRLKTKIGRPSDTDVILKGGESNERIGRRFLGTQVAAQRWIHQSSLLKQTNAHRRWDNLDKMLEEEWDDTGQLADQNDL